MRIDAVTRPGRGDDRPVGDGALVRDLGPEVAPDLGRQEACELRIPVAVLAATRAPVVAKRERDLEMAPGAGEGDVEQPALFLDLLSSPVAMSDGIFPSAAWMTCTTSHSQPLAEWIVERTR